ncbi:hypothetical protein FOCC_FOCC015990, partial [Frankliniella occidentalis]
MSDESRPGPVKLREGNIAANWAAFEQRLDIFVKADPSRVRAPANKWAVLMKEAGREALEVNNSFKDSLVTRTLDEQNGIVITDLSENYDAVVQAFRTYEEDKKSITCIRDAFNARRQKPGEKWSNWNWTIAQIDEEGKHSDARLQEQAASEVAQVPAVGAVGHRGSFRGHYGPPNPRGAYRRGGRGHWNGGWGDFHEVPFDCARCDTRHRPRRCPAYGVECHKCGTLGHFEKCCKTKEPRIEKKYIEVVRIVHQPYPINPTVPRTAAASAEPVSGSEYLLQDFDQLEEAQLLKTQDVCMVTSLEKSPVHQLQEYTAGLKLNVYTHLNVGGDYPLKSSNLQLQAFNGTVTKAMGSFSALVETKHGASMVLSFDVATSGTRPLLGIQACHDLNLVRLVSHPQVESLVTKPVLVRKTVDEFVAKNKDVFDGLGQLKQTIHVEVDKDSPAGMCQPRRYSVAIVDRLKIKLDSLDGFWHANLDEESSLLCSVATPFGIYKFKKMPFGLSSAPEIFQYLTDQVFGDRGATVCFDDVLVTGKDAAEHDLVLSRVLSKARSENIKFNPNKIQFKQSEVMFLGLLWSENQIKIDPGRTAAIQALKPPQSRHMLQKICGVFNHLRKFIPNKGSVSAPLCELLSSAVTFQWLPVHDEAFQKLKDCVANAPVLVPFDHTKPLVDQADASQSGLGAILLQDNQLVSSASRKLTACECNYAQIEKEMLAYKMKSFIYGMPDVKFQTDHQPPMSIFQKPVHEITNNRLKKMRLKLMMYNPRVEYLPGKYIYLADLLSRNYIEDHVADDPEMVEVVHEVTSNLSISPALMAELRSETSKDKGLQISQEALPYWILKDDLFVEDGLIILEEKVLVPPSLRSKVLKSLHVAHLGIDKTKARARQLVYWPGITNDIQTLLGNCRTCERHSPANQREPLIPHSIPELRFQKVSADIMEFRAQPYLVVVDNYSHWLEIKMLKSKSSSSVISVLREIFSTHGIPEIIFGDNNPLNSYECREYATSIGSSIITSSPEYPRSNGLAEKGVHIAKQLMNKCHDTDTHYLDALREYNNTPLTGMSFSPAQILMSRMVRTCVPTRPQALAPKIFDLGNVPQVLQNITSRRWPVEYAVGQPIVYWRTRKWYKGTIVEKLREPRSYMIKTLSGRVLRRNTWHLQPFSTRPDRPDNPPVEPYPTNVSRSVSLQIQEQQPAARPVVFDQGQDQPDLEVP